MITQSSRSNLQRQFYELIKWLKDRFSVHTLDINYFGQQVHNESAETFPKGTYLWTVDKVLGEKHDIAELTLRTSSRDRWRFTFLRRLGGRFRRMDSSSMPRVATHLNCSYAWTDCFKCGGRCLWCIHCLVSLHLSLHWSIWSVINWRYLCATRTGE